MNPNETYEALQQEIASLDMAGKYQELLPVAERFLNMAGQLYGLGDARYASALNEYATILNNMAGMYRLQGCYERSEKAYLRVREIYAAAVGKRHFLYVSSLNNLGLFYQDMQRYEEAIRLHRESLGILSEAGQENKVTVATTLINLASAMMGAGKMERVESALGQAMKLYRETVGETHPLYAYGLNALAAYHVKNDKMNDHRKETLISQIITLEWPMFVSVNNQGGKASCQSRPQTFDIMRRSQFLTWDEETLASYLEDLEKAGAAGRNLCTEKYAFMMERSCHQVQRQSPAVFSGHAI